MKTNFLLSAFVACATVLHAGPVVVETPNISLVLDAENGKGSLQRRAQQIIDNLNA